MDIFNGNRKLEELTLFGVDWGIYLRHNSDAPIAPFMYLKDGDTQYVRVLMTDGDPLAYAKQVLLSEEKPYQQIVIGFEGILRDEQGEGTDAIIVHGFDVTQPKGVSLGQRFLPKEKGKFKKIDRIVYLGNPDIPISLQHTENPDYSVEEIGFNAIRLKSEENGLENYMAVFTHNSPSVIANTIKRFLRAKFNDESSSNLDGEFKLQITDNCVKNEDLLRFLVKNAIEEELEDEGAVQWRKKTGRGILVTANYNDKCIFEKKEEKLQKDSALGQVALEELDAKFYSILQIPNARTNIEALTKMSELLKEYEKRGIATPDKRRVNANKKTSIEKKWWEFWK